MSLTLADSVELAVVERNGFIESRHAGAAVVLSPDGTLATSLGNPDATILPRSSMKPLQALACLSAGAPLVGESLAIATGSHTGTDRHASLVRAMLDAAGLNEDALACPAAWPSDSTTREELTRQGSSPSPVRMNCSGKHAAMLLTCVVNGWPTIGYLDPQHPLQVSIREVVERMTGQRVAATAIDGCGAPVHAMTLSALARASHRIGTASERSPFALHRHAGTLARAVRDHAWAVQGPGSADTVVIEQLGVFAKHGAEGVQVMVAPNGTSVAVKILDGAARAGALVALQLLQQAGGLSSSDVAAATARLPLAVTGGGVEVGSIRAAF